MAKKRCSTARTKAARALQAEHPGMSYTEALRKATLAYYLAELEQHAGVWESVLDEGYRLGVDVANGPQPQAIPHISVRMDADGMLTSLVIDPAALCGRSAVDLGQAVTVALQATFDFIQTTMIEKWAAAHEAAAKRLKRRSAAVPRGAEVPARPAPPSPSPTFKAVHSIGLTVTVDHNLRPAHVDIAPSAMSAGADALSVALARLCRDAQEDAVYDVHSKWGAALRA